MLMNGGDDDVVESRRFAVLQVADGGFADAAGGEKSRARTRLIRQRWDMPNPNSRQAGSFC